MVRSLFLIVTLLFVHCLAIAEEPNVQREANQIYGEVLSPFCPGRLLSDCPSGAASKLKAEIREKLAAGESTESVKEYLYTVYGDEIRAAPPFQSFGIVAWLTPALFLFSGFAIISFWLARNAGNREEESDETLLL